MNMKTLIAMAERVYRLVFEDCISVDKVDVILDILSAVNVRVHLYSNRKEVKLITDKYIVSAYYDIEECKMSTFVENPL